jgi:hypothetical protein
MGESRPRRCPQFKPSTPVMVADVQPGGLLFVVVGAVVVASSRYFAGLDNDLMRRIGGTPWGRGPLWFRRVLGAVLIVWGIAIFLNGH